ncbi:MAG: ATP-binding cassette domain-containing protein [Ruminococcaceae bacterium]|nr:ATP-binding cassette domain-containing protein [Oscillospiraceae bacterium]
MIERQYISSVFIDEDIEKDSYLLNIPAVRYLAEGNILNLNNRITFFVGENGTGKSTLIEAIAVAFGFNPEGGTMNFNFSTNASHSELYSKIMLTKQKYAKDGFFLRAESFYNVATNIEELDRQNAAAPPIIASYGGVSLHKQSHGESFLTLVENRFGGNGVYILDEPEAALSPMKQLTLITHIDRLLKADSQFIIATHSPILMAFPNAQILQFSDNGIKKVDYRDTEHYKISQTFFTDPEGLLRKLLP